MSFQLPTQTTKIGIGSQWFDLLSWVSLKDRITNYSKLKGNIGFQSYTTKTREETAFSPQGNELTVS